MDTATIDLDQLIRASQKNHRIDVVDVAKRLGLPVYSVTMPDDQSGNIKRDPQTGRAYIEVNGTHPLTRQRFTVAHEVAHYLKHPDVLAKRGQLDRSREFKDDAEIRLEHEADREAAAILMPDYLVKDYLETNHWSKKTKLDPEMITEIADKFRVSRAMAVTRLRDMGFAVPYLSFA